MFRIAHISDLHCGSQHFVPNLMERAIMEINELEPDVVVCSGDLTAFGYRQEYAEAKQYLERLGCETLVVVPGNHDSRNVGYLHFEEQFGERDTVVHQNGVSVVAIDSSEPGPRPRAHRPEPLSLDLGAVRPSGGLPDLCPPSPPTARSGHRPRAERRL